MRQTSFSHCGVRPEQSSVNKASWQYVRAHSKTRCNSTCEFLTYISRENRPQWCTRKYLTSGSLQEFFKSKLWFIPFAYFCGINTKYFYHDWFQANSRLSLKMELRGDKQAAPTRQSQLQPLLLGSAPLSRQGKTEQNMELLLIHPA